MEKLKEVIKVVHSLKKNWISGACSTKLFYTHIISVCQCQSLPPNLIFAGKAWCGSDQPCQTLTYYDTSIITNEKSFIIHAFEHGAIDKTKLRLNMDKLCLVGQNLCRGFNSKSGCMYAMHFLHTIPPWPHLELKIRPKQLLGYLLFEINTTDCIPWQVWVRLGISERTHLCSWTNYT
jgi:hypothetical protein